MALEDTDGTEGVGETIVSLSDCSDNELIEKAKSGNEDAFAAIVGRYKNPIVNFLFRFVNDYEEAVDLSQETFVRVYFALDRYHTNYAFSTYIYKIAANLAISELRKRKRRSVLSLTGLFSNDPEDGTEFQPPDKAKLQDTALQDRELSDHIAKAIAALPPRYKLPIVLREIEGLSYEEVSEVIGLGLGTTKSRISRARALLREKLTGYLGNDL